MTFSDFAQMMYPYIGNGSNTSEFVVSLITEIVEEPHEVESDEFNPLSHKGPSILEKIYRGTRKITKKDAGIIIAHLDRDRFERYLLTFDSDVIKLIGKAMTKKRVETFNDDFAVACANLFVLILNDCANGIRTSMGMVQTLRKQFDEFHADAMYHQFHGIVERIKADNQIAYQIRGIFGQEVGEYRIEDFIGHKTQSAVEDSFDDVYSFLQIVYENCIEMLTYDVSVTLCDRLDNYLNLPTSPDASCYSDIISELSLKLRKEIITLLCEICE